MRCPKCRTILPYEANFCPICGQALNSKHQLSKSNAIPDAERRRVTALFSDLSDYTAMTEKLDPERVKEITSHIFDGVRQVIDKYEGYIERFEGDRVLVIFGVPRTNEDHPVRAIRASIKIHEFVKSLSREFRREVGRHLSMHSGINTGLAITADANPKKNTYGVTGDAINVAARLCDLAKSDDILVGPETHKVTKVNFTFAPLRMAKVKGKAKPIPFYKVMSERGLANNSSPKPQALPEMIGRQQELAQLESQILKMVNGRGSVVNVVGEPGIGKSRLFEEFRQLEVANGTLFLEGRSISIGRKISFHPIIDLLKLWTGIIEGDTHIIASGKLEAAIRGVCGEGVEEVFPFVAAMMGIRLSGIYAERIKDLEGEALEKLILKNMRELLIRLSELTPVVFVMEDLHWADSTSLTLLKSLYHVAKNHRIVFINIFRPGYWQTNDRNIETLPQWLRETQFTEIAIKPLDIRMGAALVTSTLRVKGLGYAITQKIVDRAGGNPFFIEEILSSLIDEGVIVRSNGLVEVTEQIDNILIPPTVSDVLMARIDMLEEGAREIVKIAAVIGTAFFYRVLKDVTAPLDGVDERLSYLRDAGFIHHHTRMGESEYLFKHALLQEAVYESMLIHQRKKLHQKVARSVEKIFQERLQDFYGMLAFHYSMAEVPEKAEEYMMKAGREALRSSASSEALHYFQEVLRLCLVKNYEGFDPEKIENCEKNIAFAFYNRAQWPEAVEFFDKVLERRRSAVPKKTSIGLVKLVWNMLVLVKAIYLRVPRSRTIPKKREIETLDLYYREGLALPYVDHTRLFFGSLDLFRRTLAFDLEKIPHLSMYWLGVSAMFTTGALSFDLSSRLLEMSKRYSVGEDIASRMNHACLSTIIYHCQGAWEKVQDLDEDMLDTALGNGDLWTVSTYLWFHGIAKGEQGEFGHLLRAIDLLDNIAETYDYDQAFSNALSLKADYYIRQRNTHEAAVAIEQGISHMQEKGNEIDEIMYLGLKGEVQCMAGAVEKAYDTLSKATELSEIKGFVMPIFVAPNLKAHFYADVETLKRVTSLKEPSNLRPFQKNAYSSGKAAVRNSRKYAPYRTKILGLMGEYHWIIGKQGKAFKWWDKAIQEGEKLGARSDLSRVYFEVGKQLLEPHSKYKQLNGIDAKGYLEKARTMFNKLNLQRDLDELDKITLDRQY